MNLTYKMTNQHEKHLTITLFFITTVSIIKLMASYISQNKLELTIYIVNKI